MARKPLIGVLAIKERMEEVLDHDFDIKCAWFNEEQYCEFFPRSLIARQ